MYPSCSVFYHFRITFGELYLEMIYTTLLEPYRYPRIVPIEVTVLRGARRLRLATPLRRKYSDFVPKIWNILAKLGYQKYLQKIYISIEADMPLISPYYQLPIVVAVLEAIGMLRLSNNIYSIGRFLADYTLAYPIAELNAQEYIPGLNTAIQEEGEKLERYLNKIHTSSEKARMIVYPLQDLFPGVIFTKEYLNVNKTPLPILKRIPEATYHECSLTISLRHKQLTDPMINFLQTIPKPKKIQVEFKKCFCEQGSCTCTKAERSLHTEQLLFLRELEK